MAEQRIGFDVFARDNASNVFDKISRSSGDLEGKFSKVSRGLATVGKVAAVGLAAGIGAGAVALGKFVGDARESERVTKLTEAVIKSTGGAAKISAGQVAALSTSLSNKTGVDDELIQSGSNLLLTFKNVRNEAGKGNKVFNDATAAAVDLSAAGFGSVESSSKMLGKALNDPIAGISALGRAGVTFTGQQKEQIAAMVAAGDTLGAQKIILGEVESQVGGAAAATGTAMDKMKVSMGNLGETIGTAILPSLDKAATAVSGFITGITGAFRSGGLGGAIGYVGEQISAALPVIKAKLGEWAKAFWEWVQKATPPMLTKIGELLSALGGWIVGTALPWLGQHLVKWGKAFVEWIGPMIPPALAALGAAVGRLFNWLIDTGLPTLLSKLRQWATAFVEWIAPMIPPALLELGKLAARLVAWLVTEGLPKLVGALVKLQFALWEWIGPMIPKAVSEIGKLGARLVTWVLTEGLPNLVEKMATMGLRTMGSLRDAMIEKFADLRAWLSGIPERIVNALGALGNLLLGQGRDIISGLRSGISERWESLKEFVGGIPERVVSALGSLGNLLLGQGRDVIEGLRSGVSERWESLRELVGGFPARIAGAIGDLGSLLYGKGAAIVQGLIDGVLGKLGALRDAASRLAGEIGKFIPGSPVKEGPLRVLNNGRAGGLIASMLADGISSHGGDVARAMSQLGGSVTADVVGAASGSGSYGASVAGSSSGTAGATVNLTVNALDPVGAATAVKAALDAYVRRNGPLRGLTA